jgi:hypothetical protein
MLVLISVVVFAAEQTVTVKFDRKAELNISTTSVDLGTPFQAGNLQYYERPNAAQLSFRCNVKSSWEVRVSGTDFTTGQYSIPISQLQWSKDSGNYRNMPANGGYDVVVTANDYPTHGANWHDVNLSYRMATTGDEYEGTYQAMLTYTLFVP